MNYIITYLILGLLTFLYVIPVIHRYFAEEDFKHFYTSKSLQRYCREYWEREYNRKGLGFILFGLFFCFTIFPFFYYMAWRNRRDTPPIFGTRHAINCGINKRFILYAPKTGKLYYWCEGHVECKPITTYINELNNSLKYKGRDIVDGDTRAAHRRLYVHKTLELLYEKDSIIHMGYCNVLNGLIEPGDIHLRS